MQSAVNQTRWRIALFVIFSLPGMAISSWTSRTPEIRDILHASTSVMGWIIFGIAVGSIVGLLSASKLITRIGARSAILVSILFIAAGMIIVGAGVFLASKALVLLGLIVFGLGYGVVEVGQNVEGAALEQSLRKTVLPSLHASFSAGTLVGVGLGSVAISLKMPVVVHLILIAAMISIALFIVIKYLPSGTGRAETNAAEGRSDASDRKSRVWRNPRLLFIGIIVLGMALAEGTANDWLPIAFVDGYQVSHVAGTTIYGIFLAAMLAGRLSGGVFLDKYGRVPVLRVAALLGLVGLAIVIFSGNLLLGAVGVFLWGLGASLGFPVGLSAAGDDSRNAVQNVAFVSTIGYFAFLVGPPMIGLLGDQWGLLRALIIVLAAIFIAGIFSSAARKAN
ncbi:MFS transporter [Cohnella sp. GCM10012308]|uniref:MFS transporter n=1 Tax=Cohnella sp. GCM10012308 TaxID=3317329 RepID=UPI003605BFA2